MPNLKILLIDARNPPHPFYQLGFYRPTVSPVFVKNRENSQKNRASCAPNWQALELW